MALDPQARKYLDQMATITAVSDLSTLTPEEARENSRARLKIRPPGPNVGNVEDRNIEADDQIIPTRIYTPSGEGKFPILVWFHGGGWVAGDLDTTDSTARYLCKQANCIVVSVDYQRPPEEKFPRAAEDCYSVTKWLSQNAENINGLSKMIAIGGESAGGNLAAAVSLMCRDRGGPEIVFQLLVYPVIDRNFETPSYINCADGFGLSRVMMQWYWNHYLRNDTDANNPYAAPIKATTLENLPPGLIITAEYDPLCDEGEEYAKKLSEASVSVEYTCYKGMIHGFFSNVSMMDQAVVAVDEASNALKNAFN